MRPASIQGRVLVLFVLFLSACQTFTAPIPAAVTPRPTAAPPLSPIAPTRSQVSVAEKNDRVEIALFDSSGRTAINADIGSRIALTIAFRPSKDVVTTWNDGTTTQYSTGWSPNTIAEMRYCSGAGRACTLPSAWVPFTPEQRVDIGVDWIGLQDYGVTAQFRDANGRIIPAGYAMGESASSWVAVTGTVNESTPVAAQPPRVQTLIAQARSAFPVAGKIQVGEGHPVGAKAGSKIDVVVHFEATSPAGPVGEMRVKQSSMGRCLTADEMSDAPWEKFVAEKTYPVSVALNWTTFKLHVQYRDTQGNLSPVYCGDVAVEGSP